MTEKETIVLIHGAFTNSADWKQIASDLDQSFHVLTPDLPGHGDAAETSFTMDKAANTIHTLIQSSATGGKAHVVGHSLGAQVAIRLAEKYPNAIRTQIVSGFEIYPSLPSTPWLSRTLWAINRVENLVPRPAIRWLMDGAPIGRSYPTMKACREIAEAMNTATWPAPWPAPTLIVAAGRGGVIPSYDHPEDARRLASIGRELNDNTLAVVHPQMRHPWHQQNPDLFVSMIRAWIGGFQVPAGFENL
jgi:pimeloyl-ACP methyl ester carboxylesterase